MMKVGDKIRSARTALKVSQSKVAEALSVSRVSVTQWELGETRPDIARIPDIARVLGVTSEWLLSDDEISALPPNATIAGNVDAGQSKVPVFGQAVAGVHGEFTVPAGQIAAILDAP